MRTAVGDDICLSARRSAFSQRGVPERDPNRDLRRRVEFSFIFHSAQDGAREY
jgi:hypothetical protein